MALAWMNFKNIFSRTFFSPSFLDQKFIFGYRFHFEGKTIYKSVKNDVLSKGPSINDVKILPLLASDWSRDIGNAELGNKHGVD